ncbi:sensor histidine kinase [Candidatus Avelusimicrobium stercoris]|uniref:sensor histidine kinase n=1 Tax=Candidatus Avelusimicrobium stercoris TaxID=1947924 RepID=UPI003D1345E7
MSLFSKLFKLFLAVVLMPLIPMVLLLAYYQVHLKNNILETHANLAQIVSSSMNQHIEDLTWRLSFAQNITSTLTAHKNPTRQLQEALGANPDFLILAVLDSSGKELYRAGDTQILKQLPPINLSGDASLPELAKDRRLSVSSFDVMDGRPISEFIYPLSNGDFLYGIMSFFGILSRIQEQRIGQTGRIYIVDQNGSVYANDYQYKPAFDAEALQNAFSSKSRLIKKLNTPQETYVGAFAPTPILGAYATVLQLKSEAYRSIYYTNIIIALFLLSIATLAYFGALTFAERLGEPIGALSQAAKEVSAGNFDEKIDEDLGWGEFKHLIASFNKMTADLKDYQVLQLQAQVSEMKEQVFRAVAHDLRAPLLGLQGYLYILQSGKVSKDEEKQYLELMSQAAKNLSSLLEDVLDVSRVQAGMMMPKKESVSLPEIVKNVTDTLAPAAQEKGLTLTADIAVDRLPADPKLLQRVIMNLVSNAIKFTDKGFVRVRAWQDEKGYYLSVADSGIGISEHDLKGLFQKYHQVHTDRQGYGLGLFISRQIMQAHGGTLDVTSKPGEGSVFTLSIPKEQK